MEKTGLRVICGEIISEADLYKLKDNVYEYKPDVANKALKRTIDLFNKWNGGLDGRVRVILAPHAPDITTAETYLKCKEASEKYGMNITTHLSQAWQEVMQVKKMYGKTPPQLLYDLEVMDEHLTVTHCTYMTDHDTMLVRDSGAKILHCRSVTNPLNKWLDIGIPVGLGTDDLFHSMNELLRQNIMGLRFRARMDGGAAERMGDRPTTAELLQLSTIKGAEVMGIDSEVGSLEPGKKADIITFNMENPLLTPTIDPLSSIVFYATASDIDNVLVNGKIYKQNGMLVNVDLAKVLYDAQEKIFEMWKKFMDEDPEIRFNLSKLIPHLAF